MEEKWLQDFNLLTKYGYFGFYTYAKITQIVLIDTDTNEAWNYFTDVYFSSDIEPQEKAKYLTSSLKKINKKIKLAISSYTVSIEDFKDLYIRAVNDQIWGYTDEAIDSITKLDCVFPTLKKFVPCNDPTGGQYQLVVPLEYSLYGSNYSGNYYVMELYSSKEKINEFLTGADIVKIQSIITKCHLTYDLVNLSDRIGNIVCKFNSEIVETKPLSLGHRGIKYQIFLSTHLESTKEFTLHISQEHDNLIYTNQNSKLILTPEKPMEFGVDPNQLKTTLTVMDNDTGLIVFMTINDYSVYSNYDSQISPPNYIAQGVMKFRTFYNKGVEHRVLLKDLNGIGDIFFFIEMNEAGKRQQKWRDSFFESNNYFKSYTKNSHLSALEDIHKILNTQIFWDLEEIWLIDPYLTPNDILETVLFCSKPNIKIKCLTDFGAILRNKQTRDLLNENPGEEEQANETRFFYAKENAKQELENSIPSDTDVKLSYRTIANGYGTAFHDRYLILKYNVNKTRAWSLGISVNSLGNSHHIVQIVEAPELIADMFEKIWNDTEQDICKIFDNNVSENS